MNQSNISKSLSSLKVVSLNRKHIHACMELDQLAMNSLWTIDQWERELIDPKRFCIGILNYTRLIALASGWLVLDELHLTSVAVHPDHRNRGIGRMILVNLFQKAKEAGASRATLEVAKTNSAAQRLYTRLGFKTAGCRQNYYSDGKDALIQWLNLNQPS